MKANVAGADDKQVLFPNACALGRYARIESVMHPPFKVGFFLLGKSAQSLEFARKTTFSSVTV
jgi:hypothetical protein